MSNNKRNITSIPTEVFIKPVTPIQKRFVKAIKNNSLTIGVGPAGVGKTLLSLFTGITLVNNGRFSRLVYVRANLGVKDEEGLGYLPDGITEKVMHLSYPVVDSLSVFMRESDAKYMVNKGKIEISTLSLIRGRSLNNCFVLVDEASSIRVSGMKALLTRIGINSKLVVVGDPDMQCDLCLKSGEKDGLSDLLHRLESKDVEDTEVIQFSQNDIVRSDLVKTICSIYS
jgi:phosphate starvation-inducible PhoH-like protein